MVVEPQTRQVQMALLSILKDLIPFFEAHQLNYFAVFGTALGAFRHEGFIPWDDDIDLGMPRADYDRLIRLKDKLPDHLFLQHSSTDKNYPLYFVKIRLHDGLFKEKRLKDYAMHHGFYIDIFPWDEVPDDLGQTRRRLRRQENKYRRSIKKQNQGALYQLKFFVHQLLAGFKNRQQLFNQLENHYQRLNQRDSLALGDLMAQNTLLKSQLFPLKSLMFEGVEVKVPNQIEFYLEKTYGKDYMQLPPIEERYTHHPVAIQLPKLVRSNSSVR